MAFRIKLVILEVLFVLVPFERLVVLETLLLRLVEGRQVCIIQFVLLSGGALALFFPFPAGGRVVENGRDLGEHVHGLALHEVDVPGLANLILHLVDAELLLKVEEIVEHLHTHARDVIEKVGIGSVFLVEQVGQGEKLVLRLEERVLHPGQAHAARPEVPFDTEGEKRPLHDILVKAIIAHRLDEIDDVLHLARIDEAQAVHVPAHGITDFFDPPVVVFAEADDAPFKLGSGFGHKQEERSAIGFRAPKSPLDDGVNPAARKKTVLALRTSFPRVLGTKSVRRV